MLQVPQQYPPEVREVLIRSRNSATLYDYSQPDYEDLKRRRQRWVPVCMGWKAIRMGDRGAFQEVSTASAKGSRGDEGVQALGCRWLGPELCGATGD
jgi:hypothetical protein